MVRICSMKITEDVKTYAAERELSDDRASSASRVPKFTAKFSRSSTAAVTATSSPTTAAIS
jgi:hypothetical protein